MDFLKTLLLYMTITMATAVQDGPLPQDVPTPTVTPTAQVQEQETPGPETTEIPGLQVALPETATPEPAPTEVPEPTITPNKAYKNLEYGDRGKDVTKMQERLIELGYLPEGAADGAFGYQTARAVRAFQEANGLARDGVAGPATLTHLYEDPNVVATTTAEPPATDTPEPTATETAAPIETIAPPEAGQEDAAEPEEDEAEPQSAPEAAGEANEAVPEEPDASGQAEAAQANELGLTEVENPSVVLDGSSARLSSLRLSDGVMVPFYPRVWLNANGEAAVSLRDMADSVTAWVLQIEDDVYTLNAAGYTVVITVAEDAITAAVDGEEIPLEAGEALAGGEDVFVTEGFLRRALGADTLWDADERTLMLSIPGKEAAGAND